MANVELETLQVVLEANAKGFEKQMTKINADTARQTAAMEARFSSLEKSIKRSMERSQKSMAQNFSSSGMDRAFSGMTKSLGGMVGNVLKVGGALAIAAALGKELVEGVAQYGDTWNAVGNRLRTAGVAAKDIADEQGRVSDLALKSHADLGATADLYAKMLGVSQSLGQSNATAADATQAVAQALSLAGVSAESAKGTITQLGQALGSGVLRGDEFNSIMESLGTQSPLIRSIAREFGVSANELRAMAAAGQLTSDRVFKAIVDAKPEIEDLAKATVPTLSQAWTDLDTATTRWVATTLGGEKVANGISAAMAELAKRIDGVSAAYEKSRKAQAQQADIKDEQDVGKYPAIIADLRKQIADETAANGEKNAQWLSEMRQALQQTEEEYDLLKKKVGVRKEELAVIQKITDAQQELLRETARTRGTSGHADPVQDMLDKRTRDAGLSDKEAELAKATDTIIEAMKKAGTKLSGFALEDAARAQAEREYSLRTGVQATEAIVKAYVDRVVKVESGGDPRAKNPNSSATGVGQFIESTWIELFRKYYPQQAATMGRDAILELRKDGNISRDLIEKYAAENAAVLQKAGVSVNEAALQLSHFLGAGDAAKVLKAAPGTPLQGLISQKSINANPSILGGGRTVDDAIAYAQRRASDTRVAAGDLTGDERRLQTLKEIIDENQKDIDGLKRKDAALGQTAVQAEYLAKRQEMINQATQASIALTPQEIALIEEKARKYAEASVASDNLHKRQTELIDAQREFASLAVDGLTGLIDGSKDLKGALEDVLQSLIRLVLQAALLGEGPLAGLFGGKSNSGGLLGGLLGGLFKAEGGYISGPGTGTSDSIPARLSNGEFVVRASQTRKHRALLERINGGGSAAFANGGYVSPRLPTSFNVSAAAPSTSGAGASSFNMPISIDARGATRDAIPALQAEIIKLRREIPTLVLNARKRGVL